MQNLLEVPVYKNLDYAGPVRTYRGTLGSVTVQAEVYSHMAIKPSSLLRDLRWIRLRTWKTEGRCGTSLAGEKEVEIWSRVGECFRSPDGKFLMYSKNSMVYIDFWEEISKGCLIEKSPQKT